MIGLLGVKPLLGVIAVLVILGGAQTCRLDRAKQKLASYKVAVEQCATTNDKNSKTIMELDSAQKLCFAGREADERLFGEVQVRWDMERGYLDERAQETGAQRIEVYRDPTCADFAKMDIRALCPGLANGLWRQAQSYHRIRNSGEAGAGEDPDTVEPISPP